MASLGRFLAPTRGRRLSIARLLLRGNTYRCPCTQNGFCYSKPSRSRFARRTKVGTAETGKIKPEVETPPGGGCLNQNRRRYRRGGKACTQSSDLSEFCFCTVQPATRYLLSLSSTSRCCRSVFIMVYFGFHIC